MNRAISSSSSSHYRSYLFVYVHLLFLYVFPSGRLSARMHNKLRSISSFSLAALLPSSEQSRATGGGRQIHFKVVRAEEAAPMKKHASAESQERDGRSSKYRLDLSIIIPSPHRIVVSRAAPAVPRYCPSGSCCVFFVTRIPVPTRRGDVRGGKREQ